MTLSINVISPYFSRLSWPCLKATQQLLDRGCKCHIKKNKKEGDIEVNTKKKIQSDLEALYTGPQIMSHYVYAQLYTYLWACLMYSSGMPILYPIGMMFFFILYWVYKGLLLNYYQKTSRFNEQLPRYVVRYIKFGLIFHLIIGFLMYSNSRILSTTEKSDLGMISEILDQIKIKFFATRFASVHTQLYFLLFILILVYYLSRTLFYQFFGRFIKQLFYCYKEQKKTVEIADNEYDMSAYQVRSSDIY